MNVHHEQEAVKLKIINYTKYIVRTISREKKAVSEKFFGFNTWGIVRLIELI